MFSALNTKILCLALGLLVVGYILLAQGPVNNHLSLSIAPVVLIVAYCVVIPFAILAKEKQSGKQTPQKTARQGV